jgi:hypothetical protein
MTRSREDTMIFTSIAWTVAGAESDHDITDLA